MTDLGPQSDIFSDPQSTSAHGYVGGGSRDSADACASWLCAGADGYACFQVGPDGRAHADGAHRGDEREHATALRGGVRARVAQLGAATNQAPLAHRLSRAAT